MTDAQGKNAFPQNGFPKRPAPTVAERKGGALVPKPGAIGRIEPSPPEAAEPAPNSLAGAARQARDADFGDFPDLRGIPIRPPVDGLTVAELAATLARAPLWRTLADYGLDDADRLVGRLARSGPVWLAVGLNASLAGVRDAWRASPEIPASRMLATVTATDVAITGLDWLAASRGCTKRAERYYPRGVGAALQ